MKKVHRLQAAKDFKLLFGRGRRFESPFFRVVVRKNEVGRARLVCVVQNAIDKRSSARNRLRRRAREWIRRQRPQFIVRPLDVAVVFKKRVADLPRKNFYEELKKIFAEVDG